MDMTGFCHGGGGVRYLLLDEIYVSGAGAAAERGRLDRRTGAQQHRAGGHSHDGAADQDPRQP
jgi:hypothetical protein